MRRVRDATTFLIGLRVTGRRSEHETCLSLALALWRRLCPVYLSGGHWFVDRSKSCAGCTSRTDKRSARVTDGRRVLSTESFRTEDQRALAVCDQLSRLIDPFVLNEKVTFEYADI
jgi:hypothetical protein